MFFVLSGQIKTLYIRSLSGLIGEQLRKELSGVEVYGK